MELSNERNVSPLISGVFQSCPVHRIQDNPVFYEQHHIYTHLHVHLMTTSSRPDFDIKTTWHSTCDYKHISISNVAAFESPRLSTGTGARRELSLLPPHCTESMCCYPRQWLQYSPLLCFQFGARLETSFFSCLHREWLSVGTLVYPPASGLWRRHCIYTV